MTVAFSKYYLNYIEFQNRLKLLSSYVMGFKQAFFQWFLVSVSYFLSPRKKGIISFELVKETE